MGGQSKWGKGKPLYECTFHMSHVNDVNIKFGWELDWKMCSVFVFYLFWNAWCHLKSWYHSSWLPVRALSGLWDLLFLMWLLLLKSRSPFFGFNFSSFCFSFVLFGAISNVCAFSSLEHNVNIIFYLETFQMNPSHLCWQFKSNVSWFVSSRKSNKKTTHTHTHTMAFLLISTDFTWLWVYNCWYCHVENVCFFVSVKRTLCLSSWSFVPLCEFDCVKRYWHQLKHKWSKKCIIFSSRPVKNYNNN